jgi:hypothetical protein
LIQQEVIQNLAATDDHLRLIIFGAHPKPNQECPGALEQTLFDN